MAHRMWSLAEFRFDEGIEATEVEVYLEPNGEDDLLGHLEPMARDEAIAYAHEQGANLVLEWPPDEQSAPICIVAKVSLPLRWERAPVEEPEVDERLWFDAPCGSRDFLVGNGHTFRGRMTAWCPHDGVAYNVSRGGMGAMSEETGYFVAGFLAGNEPRYPTGTYGKPDEADLAAWRAATARFRRTGYWFGRWRTCQECGCVLLPDTNEDRCYEHSTGG